MDQAEVSGGDARRVIVRSIIVRGWEGNEAAIRARHMGVSKPIGGKSRERVGCMAVNTRDSKGGGMLDPGPIRDGHV